MVLYNTAARWLILLVMGLMVLLPARAAEPDPVVPPSLQATDAEPLGPRVPLVLVHGINPNPDVRYGWEGFLEYSETVPGFKRYYKTYLFVFDPALPVIENGEKLRLALHSLTDPLPPDRPVRIAALSLGGMLVRTALADAALQARVDRFIAIGVPFHGSPLANPQWIRAQVKEDSPFSVLRLVNRVAYWETRRRFPHFIADFCWDNFDGAIPTRIRQKAPCQATDYGPDRVSVPTLLYAGYFGASTEQQRWLRQFLALTGGASETRKRGLNLFSRHVMFRVVQPAISGLPLAERPLDETAGPHYPPIWAYNDGISPISSQLWLGRFVQSMDGLPVPPAALWEQVARLKEDPGTRLFAGLDHRDWLEGKTRLKRESALKDLLHPGEPGRNIFEWLVTDLSRQTPVLVQVKPPDGTSGN